MSCPIFKLVTSQFSVNDSWTFTFGTPNLEHLFVFLLKDLLHIFFFFFFSPAVTFTSISDNLTVKSIHFTTAAECLWDVWLPAWNVFMMYCAVRVLNHTAQQYAELTEFRHWITLILFEQVGLILPSKHPPSPLPFTACEGELEAVKLGHFHSLLHSMNLDG